MAQNGNIVISTRNLAKDLPLGKTVVHALRGVDMDIYAGEIVGIVGPSGSGKSTLLGLIGGLDQPTSGTIMIDGVDISRMNEDQLTEIRNEKIGFIFQFFNLIPTLTALENVALPIQFARKPRFNPEKRAKELLEGLGLGDRMRHRPSELSGGQQQRVALGRALVKEPDILLFDEPLSNLDARLRLTMRAEIKALQKRLGITSVYVTHDQVEALTMADRIAVMNKGRLEAYATPEDLYDHPRTTFIANFVGNPPINMVDVELAQENGQVVARCAAFTVPLDSERVRKAVAHGRKLTMGIRAEDITLGDDAALTGEVYAVEPLGREDMLDVRIGAESFFALATPQQRMRAGDRIGLQIDAERLQFFDPATGKSVLWE